MSPKRYSPSNRRNSGHSSSSSNKSSNHIFRNRIRRYGKKSGSPIHNVRIPSPDRGMPHAKLRDRQAYSPERSFHQDRTRRDSSISNRARKDFSYVPRRDRIIPPPQRVGRGIYNSDRRSPGRYISPDKKFKNYEYKRTPHKLEDNKQELQYEPFNKFVSNKSLRENDQQQPHIEPDSREVIPSKANENPKDSNILPSQNNQKTFLLADQRNIRRVKQRPGNLEWRPIIFPQSTVNRSIVSPFLLRVFLKINGEHQLNDFAIRSKEPIEDELQLYFWMDTTLRELVDLVKDVSLESRNRSSFWKFRLIYQDKQGKISMNEIGTVHSTRIDPHMDNKTLEQIKFQIGDYIDISINTGRKRLDVQDEKRQKAEQETISKIPQEIPDPNQDKNNSVMEENKPEL